jgi:hypothetical protein
VGDRVFKRSSRATCLLDRASTTGFDGRTFQFFGDRMDIKAPVRGRDGCGPVLPISPESKKSLKKCQGRTLILSGDGITPTLCHANVVRAWFRADAADFSWRGSARRVIFRLVRSRTALPPGVAGVGIGI